ncbi:MAG: TIM barrel protein [Alphaproteobacteria bacterium]
MWSGIYNVGYSIPNEGDYSFKQLGAALNEAVGVGACFVELPLYSLDVIGNGCVLPSRLKMLKAAISAHPLRYTVHGSAIINFFRDSVPLPLQKDVLKASLEVTAELGAINYVVHSGVTEDTPSDGDTETYYARQREALAEAGEIAADLGVTIVVENVQPGKPNRYTALPSRLAQELALIGNPSVRACLDFSHAVINSNLRGVDFMDEIAALAPFASQCHVHDSFGRVTHLETLHRAERLAFGEGDMHLPPGMGNIPWDALLERCAFSEENVFILEISPHYWNCLPEAMALLRTMAAKAG